MPTKKLRLLSKASKASLGLHTIKWKRFILTGKTPKRKLFWKENRKFSSNVSLFKNIADFFFFFFTTFFSLILPARRSRTFSPSHPPLLFLLLLLLLPFSTELTLLLPLSKTKSNESPRFFFVIDMNALSSFFSAATLTGCQHLLCLFLTVGRKNDKEFSLFLLSLSPPSLFFTL